MDVPFSDWDRASADNPMKLKARVMMTTVRDINGGYLLDVPDRDHWQAS